MKTHCVYCEIGSESLNLILMIFIHQRVNKETVGEQADYWILPGM
jgi:hypothetical protein